MTYPDAAINQSLMSLGIIAHPIAPNAPTIPEGWHIKVSLADPGFKGRRAKWRVLVVRSDIDPQLDARNIKARDLKARGLLRVAYLRGRRSDAEARGARMARSLARRAAPTE